MGKAIAYVISAVVGILLLRATGLLDGMFSRSNMEERRQFWQETIARDLPAGARQSAVDAQVAPHGIKLELFK